MIYFELFYTFFLIGAFTFGGGYAMLPLMQSQVTAKGWVDEQKIVDFIAVSESTPGPFAVNMATYVGAEMGGIWGSACATLGVVLPSFAVILVVAKCYDKFRNSSAVKGCMSGLKPAVVGLIASAIVSVGADVFFSAGMFFSSTLWLSLAIFAVMLVLAFKKMHPIIIIVLSAVIGVGSGLLGLWK